MPRKNRFILVASISLLVSGGVPATEKGSGNNPSSMIHVSAYTGVVREARALLIDNLGPVENIAAFHFTTSDTDRDCSFKVDVICKQMTPGKYAQSEYKHIGDSKQSEEYRKLGRDIKDVKEKVRENHNMATRSSVTCFAKSETDKKIWRDLINLRGKSYAVSGNVDISTTDQPYITFFARTGFFEIWKVAEVSP